MKMKKNASNVLLKTDVTNVKMRILANHVLKITALMIKINV